LERKTMSKIKLGVALFLSAAALTGAACGSDDDPAEPEAGAQQTEEQDGAAPRRGFAGGHYEDLTPEKCEAAGGRFDSDRNSCFLEGRRR
jgi:hypothetical protein